MDVFDEGEEGGEMWWWWWSGGVDSSRGELSGLGVL